MVNKSLFQTKKGKSTDTVNLAGGEAYSLKPENKLAQFCVTSCLNDVYYDSAASQLTQIVELAQQCEVEFLAKLCVFARSSKMKDTSAILLAVLANKLSEDSDRVLFQWTFSKVINNTKMLRNFVQVIRSGVTGRKSFGSFIKRQINNWLASQSVDSLFVNSIGNDPSLADVVKITHPKAENKEKESFYGWLLGKKVENLPKLIQQFEDFKKGVGEVPSVPFQMLSNITLTKEQWKTVAKNMTWNQLRLNLNTLHRNGVLHELEDFISNKLSDKNEVLKSGVFPYAIYTALKFGTDLPQKVSIALQKALDYACENVPDLGKTTVVIDVSGSMYSPVTGARKGSTTKVNCVEVAALTAAIFAKKNIGQVIIFSDNAQEVKYNPLDSVWTITEKILALGYGGGTNMSAAFEFIVNANNKPNSVLTFSDMQSWMDCGETEPKVLQLQKHHKTKFVYVNLQPYCDTQMYDKHGVLNIAGWNENVFDIITDFVNEKVTDFVQVVNEIELYS